MNATDPFTTAANAAAMEYARTPRMNVGTVRDRIGEAHADGWEAARSHLAAQAVSDEEAIAYLAAFVEDLSPGEGDDWTPDTMARVKRGLRAARRARGGTT